jgi:hypothetical protein
MLMAHVFEELDIINGIQNSTKLKALVDACDPTTRASFNAVATFLKTGDYQMLLRIRNNASFHYDGQRKRSTISSPGMAQHTRWDMTRLIGISKWAIWP